MAVKDCCHGETWPMVRDVNLNDGIVAKETGLDPRGLDTSILRRGAALKVPKILGYPDPRAAYVST